MIQISIITVGMNHLSYLKPLLASIYGENEPKTPFEMIYVDNCSTDGSVEYIRANYPQVKVIVNTEPLGFGENNNKGVFASTGKYIAIINPDIVMHSGSLDRLFNFAESHPDVGIIVPKLLNPDGTFQYSVRGFISLSILLARIRTKGNDKATERQIKKLTNTCAGIWIMTRHKLWIGLSVRLFSYQETGLQNLEALTWIISCTWKMKIFACVRGN